MLIFVIGMVGSGKTLFLVIHALSTWWKKIYANFHIKHPKFHFLEIDDFLDLPDNTDVFLDEAYRLLESRRSMDSVNIVISQIKEQRRKTNSYWYLTAQRKDLLDTRFRTNSNLLVECKTRLPIGKSVDDFVYKITDNDLNRVFYQYYSYQDAEPLFSYFNTNEKVPVTNFGKVEYELIKDNPQKIVPKAIEIWNIIKNDINEITHHTIKFALFQNKIYHKWEKWVYIYAKKQVEVNNDNE